jgi:hypothetical protein
MKNVKLSVAMLMAACGLAQGLSPVAQAQVMTPPPPKPAPTAPYTPPPPAPAPAPTPAPTQAPASAPEAPIAPPDLAELDAKGKLVVYQTPTEEIALGKLKLSPDTESLREAVRAERRARLEERLWQNATSALTIRSIYRTIGSAKMEDLLALQRPVQAVQVQPSLATMYQQVNAIRAVELTAVTESVKNYDLKLRLEREKQLGTNSPEMRNWIVSSAVRSAVMEAMIALDRMLVAAANDWSKIKTTLDPKLDDSAFAPLEAQVASAASPAQKAEVMEKVLLMLSEPQRTQVLKAVATPLPTKSVLPTQPAPGAPNVMRPQPVNPRPTAPQNK